MWACPCFLQAYHIKVENHLFQDSDSFVGTSTVLRAYAEVPLDSLPASLILRLGLPRPDLRVLLSSSVCVRLGLGILIDVLSPAHDPVALLRS